MRARLAYFLIVLGILVAAVAASHCRSAARCGPAQSRFRRLSADRTPRSMIPELPVRIADIDEESLGRIGQWPWPRTVLADLVRKLQSQGAAVIAFDMVLPEPDRLSPESDRCSASPPASPTTGSRPRSPSCRATTACSPRRSPARPSSSVSREPSIRPTRSPMQRRGSPSRVTTPAPSCRPLPAQPRASPPSEPTPAVWARSIGCPRSTRRCADCRWS